MADDVDEAGSGHDPVASVPGLGDACFVVVEEVADAGGGEEPLLTLAMSLLIRSRPKAGSRRRRSWPTGR